MTQNTIHTLYFSPTGTTQKVVTTIANQLSELLKCDVVEHDFTLPQARAQQYIFDSNDLVVVGVPVYAGRVPNVLLKFLNTIEGGNALSVAVTVFGNRNFDDALVELRDLLNAHNFRTIAAGAFVGEHSFSTTLAAGRPDEEDLETIRQFANDINSKLVSNSPTTNFLIEGTPFPYSGYFQPQTAEQKSFDIRKVKPITTNSCTLCNTCVNVCPMGSIDSNNPANVVGICIKCGACIKKCPQHAKQFTDPNYLFHKQDIERRCGGYRAIPKIFM